MKSQIRVKKFLHINLINIKKYSEVFVITLLIKLVLGLCYSCDQVIENLRNSKRGLHKIKLLFIGFVFQNDEYCNCKKFLLEDKL